MFANNKIRLLVTSECNINCWYCHNEGMPYEVEYMSRNLIDYIENFLGNYRCMVARIVYSGGEALLHDNILDYIAKLRKFTESASLVTNGILVTEDLIKQLKSVGLSKMRLGIDSFRRKRSRPTHGSCEHVNPTEIINICRDNGIIIELNIVLTEYNIGELDEIIDYCFDNSINAKYFRVIREIIDDDGDFVGYEHKDHNYVDKFINSINRYVGAKINRDYDGANTVVLNNGTILRYCELLCSKELCWKSGTRISPNGEIYTCMQARRNPNNIRKIKYDYDIDYESFNIIKKGRCAVAV